MQSQTAPGERIYVIGDVNGRLDLLAELIGRIRQDSAKRGKAKTTIVQLGNLVGRGSASAELVTRFMNYTRLSSEVIVLKGRLEAMMAEALDGNLMLFGLWLQLGGDAVLASWGVDEQVIASRHSPDLLRAAHMVVPQAALEWLQRLPSSYGSGDYLFVAAGDRSGSFNRGAKDLVRISNDMIQQNDPDVLSALGLETTACWTLRSGSDVGKAAPSFRISMRPPTTRKQPMMEHL